MEHELLVKVDLKDGCIGFLRADNTLKMKLSKEESRGKYEEEIVFLDANYKNSTLPGCQEYYKERMEIINSQLKKLGD